MAPATDVISTIWHTITITALRKKPALFDTKNRTTHESDNYPACVHSVASNRTDSLVLAAFEPTGRSVQPSLSIALTAALSVSLPPTLSMHGFFLLPPVFIFR